MCPRPKMRLERGEPPLFYLMLVTVPRIYKCYKRSTSPAVTQALNLFWWACYHLYFGLAVAYGDKFR